MAIQPGDILFYRPTTWYERVIAQRTGGEFAHCEWAIGNGQSIGAIGRPGVVRHPVPDNAVVVPTGGLLAADPVRLQWAQDFAAARVGSAYSYLDIAADAVQVLVGHSTPFLVAPSALDCSQLCTLCLQIGGMRLPDRFWLAPALISPNELFRALQPALVH